MKLRLDAGFYLLLIVLLCIYLYLAYELFPWLVDDLYIYFRYAANFAGGGGIAFNTGERVEGFSSFSWFMWLSLGQVTGFAPESFAKYSSLALGSANAIITAILSRSYQSGRFAIIPPLMIMFSLPYILWSVSGFEIMLMIFLLLLSVILLTRGGSARAMYLLGFLLFLVTITRPEGILFAAAITAWMYIADGGFGRIRISMAVFAPLLAVFLAFRFFYFGDLLPNTYYAKLGHSFAGMYEFRSYRNGLLYFVWFLEANPQFIPAAIFAPFALLKRTGGRLMQITSLLFYCQLAFIVFSGGDWMVQYRFAVTAIPFLSLLTGGLIMIALNTERNAVAAAVSVLLTLLSVYSVVNADRSIINREIQLWNNLKVIAPSMREIIPEGSLAGSGACGIIPYHLEDVRFIDMVGLSDKVIAKGGYRSGMWFERSLPEYVYSKEPQYLLMWKKKSGDEYSYKDAAPVYNEMAVHPRFADFEIVRTYDLLQDVKLEIFRRKAL